MNQKERKIKLLQKKLAKSINRKPMLPGGISRHFNVCGKSNCKCKDPKHPVKHGPYYQLSFTLAGRSSSFFVKQKDLSQARQCVQHYQEFRKLTTSLIQAYVDFIRKQGFSLKSL